MEPGAHGANNFDAVRLAAALAVLLSHQFAVTGLAEPRVFVEQTLGSMGVVTFFAISGYLVAQSWEADPHAGRFAVRRLLRIWPGLAVVVLLTIAVLGPLVSPLPPARYFAHPQTIDYLKNLQFNIRYELPLRFEGSAMPTAVNGPLWTLPLELRCYLLLALVAMGGLLRLRWLLLAALAAGAAAYFGPVPAADGWTAPLHWTQERRFPLEYALFFFAGTAFHAFRIQDSVAKTCIVVALAWVFGAVALALNQAMLAIWLVTPVTVLALANAATPGVRAAGRFGDLSYGVYIYAFPVQQTLIWTLRDKLSWGALLLLTLATTLAFAYASWHLVEKRALRLKPRRRTVATPDGAPPVVAAR